ncbi:MAG TPA: hypothetical protein DIT64_13805, partial [Verrucomicrobiales bacterium]|nr:hypothetical protein [Verrucomicrobiales bacterium]
MKHNAITFILAVFSVTLAPLSAATLYQWSDNGSSNSWNDPSNWQNSNGNIPDGLAYGANFNGSATAGTRCFVTNQAGTVGLARTLASYGFYGTNSGDNWRIYAYQGEVASTDVSVTVHGTLASDLTGGASADLYHLLIIPSVANVTWTSSGANLNLRVGLSGSGTITGDNTAGGGMSVYGQGGFSGTINTGKNQIDIQNTLALENATINLQDTTANRLVYVDGTKIKAISGSGLLDLAAGKTLNVGDNNGTDFTFGGLLSGSGDLVKLGSAKWTLNGHTNTQTGKTIINGGSIKVGNLSAVSHSEVVINVNNGLDTSTFHLAGQTVPIGGLSGSGNLNFAYATLKIDGTSSASYTGTLSGTNGNLLMQSGSANLAGAVTIGGNVTVEGGTLTLSGTTNHGGSTTINGGNLVVSGTPAFSGPITVNGGSLRINTSNQIPSLLGTLNLNNGGNVVINGASHRIARLVVSSTNNEIFVNNGELILGENNDNIVIPCELAGIGANTVLRKQGAGTLFIASTNNAQFGNFNGTVHVEAGVLSWGDGTLRGGFNPDNIVVSS